MEFFTQIVGGLFQSPVGILSLLTIFTILCIATFLFFWVKRQAAKDAARYGQDKVG